MDWFLYDNGLRHEKVNLIESVNHMLHEESALFQT